MKVLKSCKGFTLLEAVVVLAILCIITVVFPIACMNNTWWTEEGVLKGLKGINQPVEKIVSTQRNIFALSQITTLQTDGTKKVYRLDSNILFNYKFSGSGFYE